MKVVRETRSNTLSPVLGTLESLLSNSSHCWATWLTLGSELLTSWKPVMFAPPFLKSVRSISRKPWERTKRQMNCHSQEKKEEMLRFLQSTVTYCLLISVWVMWRMYSSCCIEIGKRHRGISPKSPSNGRHHVNMIWNVMWTVVTTPLVHPLKTAIENVNKSEASDSSSISRHGVVTRTLLSWLIRDIFTDIESSFLQCFDPNKVSRDNKEWVTTWVISKLFWLEGLKTDQYLLLTHEHRLWL